MLTITNFYDEIHQRNALFLKPSDTFMSSFVSNSKQINIQFMIDISGSMLDNLKHCRVTKYEIVRRSLNNILDYFMSLSLEGQKICFSLSTFNSEVSHVIMDTYVTLENINELKSQIDTIAVFGNTNITSSLNYCNQWLQSKSICENANNFVIFITDGYHSKRCEIHNLIETFSQFDNSRYYSIGLGVSGEYDHELMSKLFANFTGCPNAESINDNIIGSVFSRTTSILSNVKISFSENVFNIKTSLNKIDNYYYVDKIDLSTKIPFSFTLVENNYMYVEGIDTNGNQVNCQFDLNNNVIQKSVVLFDKYFDAETEYLSIIEKSESNNTCRLKLDALLLELNNTVKTILTTLDELQPFYLNLISKINNFISNIESVFVRNLNDEEFKHWLQLGSVALRHASANVIVPQLSRQASITMTKQYSMHTNIPMPSSLKRGLNVRHTSAPLERVINPISRKLSTVIEESMCKICYSNPIQVVSLPCKHATSCLDCVRHMNDCPICRVKVVSGKELKIGSKCVKCNSHQPNILFLPCAHVIVCEECVDKKTTTLCNSCGKNFTSYCKLFV
jgi:hypothetical protein